MTTATNARLPGSVPPANNPRAGKYLTFRLGREEFGIQVRHVREIMGVQDITPVPGTAPHLKGVINLRGKIVPVVDLRVRFSFSDTPFTHTTCIVVVQVEQEGVPALIGLIVDIVCEVLNIAGHDIEDPPNFDTLYVLGIAKLKGAVKVLLKIEDVLTLKELRGSICSRIANADGNL
ncbi:MAG TPA: chemotaxis protein CheW [Bryobacteraceae bacterium]|jgi:purine-binding chemotaxis protein CheW|nr:chemotaxis protein CheW [Bryobacteraceae bacterium]